MNPETNALNKAYRALETKNWHFELIDVSEDRELKLDRAFRNLPKSEAWAATAIAHKFANYLTYSPTDDQWYFWDGRIHRPCVGDGLVKKIIVEYYQATVNAINAIEAYIIESAPSQADPKAYKQSELGRLKDYKNFRDSISKASGHSSMAKVMQLKVDVAPDHYGNDTRWFVVENGVYDMDEVRKTRQFKLLTHDPARPVYREWNLIEEVGASHSALDDFTSQSIEDEGQARFLQKILGTALMGITPEVRSIVSAQGAPSSGKSMLLRVLGRLGPDFVAEPPRDAIVKVSKSPEHARYKMMDARVAGFTEITDKLNREFILKYSGMDQLSAEEKYVASKTWKPQGIIFMFSNHGMNIDKTDEAVYGRIKPINFPHTFQRASPTGHELDVTLEDRIVEQRAGFLEWIKEGFLMGLEEGFDCTDSMEALKREERDEEDEVALYLADRLEAGVFIENFDAPESHCATVMDVWRDYQLWHKHSGSGPLPKRGEVVEKVQKRYSKSSTGAKKFKGLVKVAEIFKV